MKRVKRILALSLALISAGSAFAKKAESAEEKDLYEYNNIVANLTKATSPKVLETRVVFTANPEPRFVGIAFDFEEYKTVHPFERHVCRDIDGNVTSEVLFYVLDRGKNMTRVNYRMVIDGLWTEDPLNKNFTYDSSTGLKISSIEIGEGLPEITRLEEPSGVKFIYKGETGLTVRLGGNFTAWDSWIYELTETSEGFYEITLPLPRGKYYYNYFIGMNCYVDKTNPDRVYSEDGRTSSVIVVN